MNVIAKLLTTGLLAGSLIQPAAARDILINSGETTRDIRAEVGITIPFGRSGSTQDRAPRAEFAMSRYRYNGTESDFRPLTRLESKSNIAFTFEDKPTLLLNGRPMESGEERNNISTGAAIGIGVGVLIVGSMVILITDTRDAVSDLIGPAD